MPAQAYMPMDKAAEVVGKVMVGKASPWAIRDPRVKVKPRPILNKSDGKKLMVQRTQYIDKGELTLIDLPPITDLRPFDTKIRNQGDRGWCTAFASISAIENIAKNGGKTYNLSEIYLWNLYKQYDMYEAIDAANKNFILTEKQWPYDAEKPMSVYLKRAKGVAKAKSYMELTSINDVLVAINNKKPIMLAAETTPFWGSPNRGVITPKGVVEGAHAITITGYYYDPNNETTGGGFFVFKNSWGQDWGDDGYGYLPFKYCKKYECYFIEVEGVVHNK
jgi:C1A family cysteine protease